MIYGLSIAALSPFEYNLKFVYWYGIIGKNRNLICINFA